MEMTGIFGASQQLNDAVYVLYEPPDFSFDVVFFHGFDLVGGEISSKYAYINTWRGGRGGDVIWPKEWLPRHFPKARVLTVSYDGSERYDRYGMDLYLVAEGVLYSLLSANVGQYTSVVFVAHSFGGILIKKICTMAYTSSRNSNRAIRLLRNLVGIFYYSTPHFGIRGVDTLTLLKHLFPEERSALSMIADVLDTRNLARLDADFDSLPFSWKEAGVIECLPTSLGRGLQPFLLVPEASGRCRNYRMLQEDHFSICKPKSPASSSYLFLIEFLCDIQMEDLQSLPSTRVGWLESSATLREYIDRFEKEKVIVLCGTGGLGKTTAAKAIFNSLRFDFEYTLFVEDVKYLRMDCNGDLDRFEEVLFSKFCHHGKMVTRDESLSMLSRVRGKKVLVILDDVEKEFDSLIIEKLRLRVSTDSLFLVTSRSAVVSELGLASHVQLIPFEPLDVESSKRLLTSYALSEENEVQEWKRNCISELSELCGGLPLSLETLGKFLSGKPEEEWKATVSALSGTPRITNVLRISCDSLEPREKEMFTEAATVFQKAWKGDTRASLETQRFTLREAKAMWKMRYSNDFHTLWQTLVYKGLVYNVQGDSPVEVHELLRDAVESWANQEGQVIQIRVRNQHHLSEVAQKMFGNQMLEEVRMLDVYVESNSSGRSCEIVPTGIWEKLISLQYLRLARCGVAGKQVVLPQTLLMVSINDGLINNVRFDDCSKLVHLNLVVHGEGRLAGSFHNLTNLVSLSLTSTTIRTLPDSFEKLEALEQLHIHCSCLKELPHFFGGLSRLRTFALIDGCFYTLPDSFGSLRQLQSLEIHDCINLTALPDSFGELEKLEKLTLSSCERLQALPESFGRLGLLQTLAIKDCYNLRSLPESFGKLDQLETLELCRCGSLQALPESLGDLSRLHSLTIRLCERFHAMPNSLGHLFSLKKLYVDNTQRLQRLPESFLRLGRLKEDVVVNGWRGFENVVRRYCRGSGKREETRETDVHCEKN